MGNEKDNSARTWFAGWPDGALAAILALAAFIPYANSLANGVTLYTCTLAQQPDADAILNNLGIIYWTEGNLSGAKREWDKAYRVRQNVAAVLNNLGLYYA